MFTSGLLLGIGIGCITTVAFYSVLFAIIQRYTKTEKSEMLKYWNISTNNQAEQIEVLRDILNAIDRKDEVK